MTEQHPAAKRLMEAFMKMHQTERSEHRGYKGLTASQIMVMYCLKNHAEDGKGLMVSEISRKLKVTSPTITQSLKVLEGYGLIDRKADAKDRRAVRIQLSDKGLKVLKQVTQIILDSFNGLVEHLGEEESLQLAELLQKATVYLQQRHESMRQLLTDGDDER